MKLLQQLFDNRDTVERRNSIADAGNKISELEARINGEEGWFLTAAKRKTLDDINEKIDHAKDEVIRTVEETCGGLI